VTKLTELDVQISVLGTALQAVKMLRPLPVGMPKNKWEIVVGEGWLNDATLFLDRARKDLQEKRLASTNETLEATQQYLASVLASISGLNVRLTIGDM